MMMEMSSDPGNLDTMEFPVCFIELYIGAHSHFACA
jgi:hypothetical protein